MKQRKPMVLFFSAITLLFLLLAPPFLEDGVTRNIYRQWMSIKESPWAGVVQLWHISGWETGKSSGVQWLKNAAASYEKSYPGMYIEVAGMTVEEAQQRLQKGERADLYSFPLGFVPPEEFCVIDAPQNIQGNVLKSGQYQGQQIALPYMMGGYALIINRSIFFEHQLLLPSDEEWTVESLKEAVMQLSNGDHIAIGYDVGQFTIPGAALLIYGGENITGGKAVQTENAYDAFFNQELGILIGTQKEITSFRDISIGVGPDTEMLVLGGYTDMVQYIAVRRDDNALKNECCIRFAQNLCSGRQQQKLEKLNVFPVSQMEIYEDNDVIHQLYQSLQDALIPNCFIWESERKPSQEIILRGIQGNGKAGEALEELVKALS